jgi:hypothetical protein
MSKKNLPQVFAFENPWLTNDNEFSCKHFEALMLSIKFSCLKFVNLSTPIELFLQFSKNAKITNYQ